MKRMNSDSWLCLCSLDERLGAMPDRYSYVVEKAFKENWDNTKIRKNSIKIALNEALALGASLPHHVSKLLSSTLRSLDNDFDLYKSHVRFMEKLEDKPHLVVFLYSKYGLTALENWHHIRENGKKQIQWNSEVERRAAELCRKQFGGIPSHEMLYNSNEPLLKKLAKHLHVAGKKEAFSKAHDLPPALKIAQKGYNKTDAKKEEVLLYYESLCLKAGRYINDHQLSVIYKENTLRANMKDIFGSVMKCFLLLVNKGRLPTNWRYHVNVPTASDGTQLDSYSEVYWYECLLKASENLPQDHSFRNVDIFTHANIGSSKYRCDFCLEGYVYIEVLRYCIRDLEEPDDKYKKDYSQKLDRRIQCYRKESLIYFLVEPDNLNDVAWLRKHFESLFELLSNQRADLPIVQKKKIRPHGYWYNPCRRKDAVLSVISHLTKADVLTNSGRYPSYKQLESHGYSGLVNYLKLLNRSGLRNRQAEAIEVNAIATSSFTHDSTDLRRPTKEEFIKVMVYHVVRLELDRGLTHVELKKVFGRTAYKWIVDEFGSSKNAADCVEAELARNSSPY